MLFFLFCRLHKLARLFIAGRFGLLRSAVHCKAHNDDTLFFNEVGAGL